MAQHTTVTKLNFEYWLDKAIEWGQATTLESQKDMCLHLPQLQEFLHQIYETLKHMDSVLAIQQFPLIGQLLGRLCWNPFVIGYDESQKTLMWCLCCLYSSEPQNPVELKANSWIRSLLCHLLSSSKWESNEAETSTFISTLGYTSADYYCHLVKNMVFSLVTELKGNQFNGLNIQGRVSASRVNAVSLFCLPLITLPDLTSLLETLLLYHGGASKEILSSEFLEAVNEAFLKKKISLPESAVFNLWLRHPPSLEKATLYLLDQLASIQLNSLEEVACVIKESLLPQAAIHPAIFRIVNEIFKNALLETSGTPEVMTIIQMFTQLFLQAHQNENKQVEAQAVYNHLMMLFSCTVLSVKDLEAAVHSIMDIEQCCNQRLIIHLLTNFLLFSSGGHMIAQEFIYHITETTDTSKEVCSILTRTAYRINRIGEENQSTVKLLNELLQKLTLKV
ncbi:Fanconi anemia group C protein isoform X3 [Athene noctua]|uniref:Fanconi anemia group C protein isoform X3 n=1 Tax=Athene noctua TaxID=126797 RepID=UPI003EBFE790